MVILSPVQIRRTRRIRPLSAYQNKPLLRNTLEEYCSNSGLHGVRYLGERGRPWSEKLWWVVVILASLTCSSLLILRVWHKWTTTPVLVTFAENPSPVWEIPFPTITLCPSNKYVKKVFDFSYYYRQVNESFLNADEQTIINAVLLLCRSLEAADFDDEVYPRFGRNIINRIQQLVSPSYYDAIECLLMFGTNITCEGLFQVLITAEGVCFSFNLLPNRTLFTPTAVQYDQEPNNSKPPIWSLEKGYIGGAGITRQPIRAAGAGLKRGVSFVLKTNMSELDYECRRTQGFRVSMTNPAEVPTDNSFYYLPTSGLTLMAIEPKVMDTSEALRVYSPYKRHCFFPSERRLAYFSTYTQSNCDLECLTNFTLRSCNCVEFYMPRNKTTLICDIGSTSCVFKAGVKDLQKKWKSLRDAFSRELRNQKMPSGSGAKRRKKYCYFDQLLFLVGTFKDGGSTSSLQDTSLTSTPAEEEEEYVEIQQQQPSTQQQGRTYSAKSKRAKQSPFEVAVLKHLEGRKTVDDEEEVALTREFMNQRIKKIKAENDCNCLPSCKTIDYKAEISQSNIELSEILQVLETDSEEYRNISVNFLYVFFKDSDFIAMRRGELYGFADLIANCGGLLGLSCGFSILSLAELLFHFTLRLWNNNKRREEAVNKSVVPISHMQKNLPPIWTQKFLY